jgi:tetratricopeptide (TPR) repeat protein
MAGVTLTLLEVMQRAVAAYQRGQLREAHDLASAILRAKADYFDALHLIAVISAQQGRLDEALASYDRALALRPDHAEALCNRGATLHQLKRFDEALASYDRALVLEPGYAEALCNRGATLHELKRFDDALASYDRALTLRPDRAGAVLFNRGNALRQLKRFDEALTSYDRALALQPDHVEALYNRGNTLHELKRFGEALASYDRALALRPDYAGALFNRGNTLRQLKRFDEALASYDRALAARPDYADALNNRGNTLHELKRFDEALASYDRALALQPDHAEALYNRGDTLHERGDLHAALAHYRRALSLKPDLADVYNNMGNVLKELGQLQEAESAYCEALRLDPNSTAAYVNLAAGKTFKPGDAHLAAMEALAKTEDLSTSDRMRLDFALGKAYADLNDHSRSFKHLFAGNAAKRATIGYDETVALGRFDRIEAVFTPELIAAKSGGGNPSALPIFVLGMPRSGTTLVEQIIASHPAVHGAGELQLLSDVVHTVRNPDGNSVPYPELTLSLDHTALHQIGARYVARLGELAAKYGAPRAERITNKMPSNYYFAGLIHLALPNAKMIHTIRDPLDTCMSCFSRLFTAEQNYTYDLGELGRYYRGYERLMAHWRRVLPAGRILDVRYEDVVADLEQQARRIIAYCELPWDDRCLSFHKTDRPVRTASATQVRQPIYTSAIGRWHAYEVHIEPLLNSLGLEAE